MVTRCKCGLTWNISIKAKIPKEGYKCPWCREKEKKEDKSLKNAKKLSRAQKKFLSDKGLEPSIHLIVKKLPEFYEFYNKVTKVTFKLWR